MLSDLSACSLLGFLTALTPVWHLINNLSLVSLIACTNTYSETLNSAGKYLGDTLRGHKQSIYYSGEGTSLSLPQTSVNLCLLIVQTNVLIITDIGSKSFIKSQNIHLVDRSELFELLVWFMMEEKL